MKEPGSIAVDFRSLFQVAPGNHLVLLPDAPRFTVVAVSDGYMKATSITEENIINRGLFDFLSGHKIHIPNLADALQYVIEHKVDHEISDYRYDHLNANRNFPNTSWRLFHKPVLDATGNVQYIIQTLDESDVNQNKGERSNGNARNITDATQPNAQTATDKYHTILSSIDEGFCIYEIIYDDSGKPVDLRWVEVNPAYAIQTGLKDVVGKSHSELGLNTESYWFEYSDKVIKTGEPFELESWHEATGRWYHVFASRIGEENSKQVAVVFSDITERKHKEQHQVFLSDISKDLVELTDVNDSIELLGEKIAREFNTAWCNFAEMIEDGETGVTTGWNSDAVSSVKGVHRLRDLWTEEQILKNKAGGLTIVSDTQNDTRVNAESYAALNMRSFITVPLAVDGEFKFMLALADNKVRQWRDDEIELVKALTTLMWARVERARAEEALQKSEEKYRMLFNSIDEGFVIQELIYDDAGKPVDVRLLENNPAHEKLTGLKNVVGKSSSELAMATESHWFEKYHYVLKTGEPLRFENWHGPTGRWYNLFLSRIGGAGSTRMALVFNEVTERKRQEQHQAFLLRFSDQLRSELTTDEVANRALEMVIEYMRLDRSYIVSYYLNDNIAILDYQIGNETVPPLPDRFDLSQYPEAYKAILNQTLVIEDDFERQGLSEEEKQNSAKLGMRAMVAATLRKGGNKPLWSMAVINSEPRRWTPDEIKLVEEVAERTWAALERAKVEEDLRTSEDKYRTLFESIDEGFCTVEVLYNDEGKANDWRYLEANKAYMSHTGQEDPSGKLGSEVTPNAEPGWLSTLESILHSGEPLRFEEFHKDTRRWYSLYMSRVDGDNSRQIATIFSDITERKHQEQLQEFLLQLSDALRRLSDPLKVLQAATQLIGEALEVDRVLYSEVCDNGERIHIEENYVRNGFPKVIGDFSVTQFGAAMDVLRRGEMLVIEDQDVTSLKLPPEREVSINLGVFASATVPLVKEGRWVANFGVLHGSPRKWTKHEMIMLKETAERTWAAFERAKAEEALRKNEERQTFLLSLSDGLRSLQNPVELQHVAMKLLAERLDVNRAAYYLLDEDEDGFLVTASYSRRPSPFPERGRLSNFDSSLIDLYRSGGIATVADTETLQPESLRNAYRAVGVRAWAVVPIVKDGHLLAAIGIQSAVARTWTETELQMLEDISDRTWAAVERAKAEEAMRESEEKYRSIFETIDEGFTVQELLVDETGNVIDMIYREANDAFAHHSGVTNVVGKKASEFVPHLEQRWLNAMTHVYKTGEPVRMEGYQADLKRWITLQYSRLGGAGSRLISAVFNDITERKRREQQQEYSLRLNDALRPLADPVEIQKEAMRVLGEQLDVDRAIYAEINIDEDWFEATDNFTSNSVQKVIGRFPFSAFGPPGEKLRRGESLVIHDVSTEVDHESQKAFYAIDVHAVVAVPLIKKGKLVADLSVHQTKPRHWLNHEVALLYETAERTWAAVERATAEEQSRQSQKRFHSIANLVPDLLWESNPNGSTNWYNQQWLHYTGQTFDQAIGWGWVDAIHPEDREGSAQRYVDAVRTGSFVRQEYRLRRYDGNYRWFDVKSSPLKNEDGEVVKMYGAATDIHDQKLAEQALRESEERFRTLAATAPAMIWQTDASGETVFVNQFYLDYTGKTVEELKGLEWHKLVHPDVAEDYISSYLVAVKNHCAWQTRNLILRYDGEWHWFENYAKPLFDSDGTYLGHVGVSVDIDGSVKTEERLRMNEQRSRIQKEAFQSAINGEPLASSLSILTRIVKEGLGTDVRTAFYLAYPDGDSLYAIEGAGDMPKSYTGPMDGFPVGVESFCSGYAISTGRPAITRDIFEDPLWQPYLDLASAHAFRSTGSFPILTREGKTIGSFALYFTEVHDATSQEFAIADAVTHGAAIILSRHTESLQRARAEASLRKSEERLQKAISIETVGVIFFNLDGFIHEANAAFEKKSRLRRQDIVEAKVKWEDLTPPEFMEASKHAVHELLTKGESTPYEKQYIRPDGSRWWGLFAAKRLSENEVVEFIIDISERKRIELAIEEDLRDMQILRELSVHSVTNEDIQTVYDKILDAAIEISHADAGTIQRLNEETDELVFLASRNIPMHIIEHFARVDANSRASTGIALKTGDRMIIDFESMRGKDASTDLHLAHGLFSAQSTPLISRSGKPIGMFSTHWRAHYTPSEGQLRFLELLARQAADLIEQRQAEEALRHLNATLEEQVARRTSELSKSKEELEKNLTILQQAEALGQIGSWEYDFDTHNFTWSNGMYQLFGIDPAAKVNPDIYVLAAVPEDKAVAEQIAHGILQGILPLPDTVCIELTERRVY